MNKDRLSGFSDGVFAIIITIMVLDLKSPKSLEWSEIKKLLSIFVTYIVSYLFVAVYWINHYRLTNMLTGVNTQILWANIYLLFWLSLIPFLTGWIDDTHFSSLPVTIYTAVQLLSGFSYYHLFKRIKFSKYYDDKDAGIFRILEKKGNVSLAGYLVAIPLAYFLPQASMVLLFAINMLWWLPNKYFKKWVMKEHLSINADDL